MADVQPILQVKDLYKRFGGLVAVDHVSLDIHPGEVVGLLGDNGAGKSTLIKMISGVYKPDGGQVLLDGEAVRSEEHTSELQSRLHLVCRLLLEKKNSPA